MRPILVNTKQKVAVLASGLAIAATGFVTDAGASNLSQPDPAQAQQTVSADAATPGR
jgi:hypothetical protein